MKIVFSYAARSNNPSALDGTFGEFPRGLEIVNDNNKRLSFVLPDDESDLSIIAEIDTITGVESVHDPMNKTETWEVDSNQAQGVYFRYELKQ